MYTVPTITKEKNIENPLKYKVQITRKPTQVHKSNHAYLTTASNPNLLTIT